jgi:putative spermidine/putrescine transport system substrate-binding protein
MQATTFKRRTFLKSSSGLLLASALPIFGREAFAQDANVIVGTWGGDYQNLLQKIVNPLAGAPIVFDTGNAVARATKIRAETKSRRGSMDVALLQDVDMYDLSLVDPFESVSVANTPNFANTYEQFRTPYSIPHIFSAMVLVYNKEKIPTPPDSFAAATDPKYRGRVGFSDILHVANTLFVGLANRGTMSTVKAGMDMLANIKKNDPKVFPSNEAVAAALKSGEIWMTCMWKARALQWQDAGLPLGFVVPKEGAVAVTFEGAVPKNSRNKPGAWKFLNAMMDPKGQVEFAKAMGYAPTVRNADLPADVKARVSFSDSEIKRVLPYDSKSLVSEKTQVLEYWNKFFKAGA